MSIALSNLRANLNVSIKKKHLACEVSKTENIVQILRVLRANRYIYGFAPLPNQKLVVYLRYYRGSPAINLLKQTSFSRARKYVSKTYESSKFLVISSPHLGVVGSRSEHLDGGELLYSVW